MSVRIPCNWKVTIDGFIEAYHIAVTHSQMLPMFGDDYSQTRPMGKHAHGGNWESQTPFGMPSPRLNLPQPSDSREAVMRALDYMGTKYRGIFTQRDIEAARKIMDILPADVDAPTAFSMAVELGRKAAEADGAGYPEGLTWEHMAKAGPLWHIFPNIATYPWFDGAMVMRARPDGDDPDKCIYDVWSLVRYAPGKEPPLERKFYDNLDGVSINEVADQDMVNFEAIQKGMKSSACTKVRPNPVQESSLINFHRVLDSYLEDQG
jgi:hypothetical protein